MMGPSKILTVSYGTFSCTLEGFDEPFSTMRGIAEYFRDLAADDRYFGAEPPTPDAEMLHRIAQRDVHSRVEAQIEDNGVILRQVEENLVEEESEPQAQVVEQPAPAAPVEAAATVTVNPSVVDDPVDVAPLIETSPVETESVAAKLARIRAVVSSDQEEDAAYAEDEQSDSMFDTSPISAAFDAGFEDEVQDEIVQEFAETEELLDEEPVEEEALEAAADETPEEIEKAEIEEPETTEFVAEEQEQGFELPVEAETEELVAGETEELTTEEVDNSSDADEDVSDTEENSISRIMGAVSTDEVEIDVEDDDAFADPDQPAIARVVKMRREDFEAALETGDLEEISDGDDIIEAQSDEAVDAADVAELEETEEQSSLSEKDEAELMANLEQVQRKADADVRAEKEGRALMENKDIEDDPDSVSRILEVTNTELEETEGTRRRSAIAHLKAAVAATRADKIFTKQREEEDANELNQYRDDLAKVVKPRRPVEAGAKSRRVAPLVLVTEQRVDAPEVEPIAEGAIVRPRRVISGNLALSEEDEIEVDEIPGENIFTPEQTFANFAKDMGAVELPDLLEAAAAYSAYVEGEAHFSRPKIMKAVAELNEEQEFTREEGLRSFGLLLRRGKIKKLKRGQFAIASTTRFNPEIRAVGE